MSMKVLKTRTKLLSLCQTHNTVYAGDFLGNIYELKDPYNNLHLVRNIDEPVSAITFYKNEVVFGTWKGNVYFNDRRVSLEDGIVKALAVYEDLLLVAINASLYMFDGNNLKYKIETTYKTNIITIHRKAIYCGLNMPFIGVLTFYDGEPIFELTDTSHHSGITGITFLDNKMHTSSYDKTIMCGNDTIYKGDDWVRCMDEDVYGLGKCVVYEGKNICIHNDWISGVLKCNDRIFSIGLDGVIQIYNTKHEYVIDDEEFDKFMQD